MIHELNIYNPFTKTCMPYREAILYVPLAIGGVDERNIQEVFRELYQRTLNMKIDPTKEV